MLKLLVLLLFVDDDAGESITLSERITPRLTTGGVEAAAAVSVVTVAVGI